MYNCQRIKILSIIAFCPIILIGVFGQATGFDLTDEVASNFQDYYKNGLSDSYMSRVYSPNFSKDPFGDAITNIEDKSMQLKIAGSQYIERLLSEDGCYLSQKKVWSILYYFLPEFRAELARNLKQELGDYDSKKYQIDEDTLLKYCREYYLCKKSQGYSASDIYRSRNVIDCDKEKGKYDKCRTDCDKQNGDRYNKCISSCESSEGSKYNECLRLLDIHDEYHLGTKISADTTEDIKTNCQEFFQLNYREGQNNEKIMQNVQVAQLGSDRYWNKTVDDSPYDIMVDLGIFAKLLYQEAEEPITPVFFDIPNFSNSKKTLSKTKMADDSVNLGGAGNGGGTANLGGAGNGGGTANLGGVGTRGGVESLISPAPLNQVGFSSEGGYDDLVEGLNSFSVVNDNSIFYGSLCDDSDEEEEPEPMYTNSDNEEDFSVADLRNFSDVSNQEYQEIIDYMLEAVNRYDELPEDMEKQIGEIAGNTSSYVSDVSDSQFESTANKIKNCWKSCDGLRIDQKASCMLKCACGEINSSQAPLKLFDPEEIPGLGPIFVIRFCTVPAVDTRFSLGGKRIHSIEEGLREIYGAVDKLSREGRLGKWTQQYEFLDSSTKQMNVADTLAFTIDIEFVDIADKMPQRSEQFEKKRLKNINDQATSVYGISNPLNNPVTKNSYAVVGYQGEDVVDYIYVANADANRRAVSEMNYQPEPFVDGTADSDAQRYNMFAEHLGRWMDQQGTLWEQTLKYVSDFINYSKELYAKRCDSKAN